MRLAVKYMHSKSIELVRGGRGALAQGVLCLLMSLFCCAGGATLAAGLGPKPDESTPIITGQPESRTNVVGSAATFAVAALGGPPMTYQWRFNGENLAEAADVLGATAATLTLAYVRTNHDGLYAVVVSNPYGSITSAVARLTVQLGSPQGPFSYATVDGAVTITGYTGAGDSVAIPETIDGMPVTGIGGQAFDGNTYLASVTIGSRVSHIGYRSFARCTNLTAAYFMGNCPTIGADAFRDSTNATLYYLLGTAGWGPTVGGRPTAVWETKPPSIIRQPDSQTNLVGRSASLTVLAAGSPPLAYRWRRNGTDLADGVDVYGAATRSLTLFNLRTNDGAAYAVLASNAYGSATSAVAKITVLQLQLSYTTDNGAITITQYFGPERSVTIPESFDGMTVTGIGNNAFNEYGAMTDITLPKTVTSIGDAAFYGCAALTNITVEVLNPDYSDNDGVLLEREQNALLYYPGARVGPYVVPNTVIRIKDRAFSYCTGLMAITLPEGLARIGSSAFYGCSGLTNVAFPESLTDIGTEAFYGCTGLTRIDLPSGLTNIADSMFLGCAALTSVSIPEGVVSISGSAFEGCSALTRCNLPNSVKSIGGGAFEHCTALTNIAIPNSVTSLGWFAFSGCKGLTDATIGNGVSRISFMTFAGCTGLMSLTMPDSLTSVESDAFYNCGGLTSVTMGSGLAVIGGGAFAGCTNLITLYFAGNAPKFESPSSLAGSGAIVYYLPGTTGWGPTFGGVPTAVWQPRVQTGDASLGVGTNQFGFDITWASDRSVAVEACADISNPVWSPVGTNTLTGGASHFSDPRWTNYPARFYRLRAQ